MEYEESSRQRRRRKILYARRLRRRMTKAESVLWEALRDRRCAGLKFRRQVAIEWFVVDFLCIEHDLVVEIDGSVHAHQRDYDQEREEILRSRRLTVLHCTNTQILHELSSVLQTIANACGTPSPCGQAVQAGRGGRG